MIRRIAGGIVAVFAILVYVLAKYVAPIVLVALVGLAAWVRDEERAVFVVVLAVFCFGGLGIALYSLQQWLEKRRNSITKRKAATLLVYLIIILAYILTGAGILDLAPEHPTFEVVLILVFAGFLGVCMLDGYRPRVPQFPSEWKDTVE